jgi:hypothetical protein
MSSSMCSLFIVLSFFLTASINHAGKKIVHYHCSFLLIKKTVYEEDRIDCGGRIFCGL